MECVQTQHNLSRTFIETRLDGYVVTSDVSLCILKKHVLTLWMLDGFSTFTLWKVQGNDKKILSHWSLFDFNGIVLPKMLLISFQTCMTSVKHKRSWWQNLNFWMNYPFNSCHVWFVDKYKSKLTQFHFNSQGKQSKVLNPSFTSPKLMVTCGKCWCVLFCCCEWIYTVISKLAG